MGNRFAVEAEIKKAMPDAEVKHSCGIPLTVRSKIGEKKGKLEVLPGYYNCPGPISKMFCKGGLEKTAANAKAIEAGAPPQSSGRPPRRRRARVAAMGRRSPNRPPS